MKRRTFLQAGITAGEVALAMQAGLMWPLRVLADEWPTRAFHATDYGGAVAALFGDEPREDGRHLEIDADDIAEDGASVPVKVHTDLEGVRTVTLLSVKNPNPAVARFEMAPELDGYLATRIKMAGTSDVVAVVTADGRHHQVSRRIKVTVGGCG